MARVLLPLSYTRMCHIQRESLRSSSLPPPAPAASDFGRPRPQSGRRQPGVHSRHVCHSCIVGTPTPCPSASQRQLCCHSRPATTPIQPLVPNACARFFTPRQRHWPRPGARPPFPRSVRPCAVRDDAKSARVNGCRRSTRMDGGRRSTRMDFGRRWTRIVVAAARRPACITLGHGVGIAGRLEAGPRGGRACGVVHSVSRNTVDSVSFITHGVGIAVRLEAGPRGGRVAGPAAAPALRICPRRASVEWERQLSWCHSLPCS